MGSHRNLSRIYAAVLAGGLALAVPSVAPAQSAGGDLWYEQITLNGFLSTTYSFNFNHPASRTNQLRVFDIDDQSFEVDVFELSVEHPVAKPGDTGFRVDAEAGQSIPRVSAAYGLFRDDSGKAEDFDLKQVFVSVIAPLGRGLRVDAGKFVTAAGYEVIEGYDGFNDNATHSFLFGYAIPFTHTGVRATYAFSGSLSGMVMVVNGWDDARNTNTAKSLGAQLAYAPSAALSVALTGITGPERAGNNHDHRSLIDLVAVWHATGGVTLGFNADYGAEAGAVVEGRTATWKGAAGYLKVPLGAATSLALRLERFEDPEGARTGVPQRLSEITVTPEYRAGSHLIVRGDLRLDRSNSPVFEKAAGTTDHQLTTCVNAIYLF